MGHVLGHVLGQLGHVLGRYRWCYGCLKYSMSSMRSPRAPTHYWKRVAYAIAFYTSCATPRTGAQPITARVINSARDAVNRCVRAGAAAAAGRTVLFKAYYMNIYEALNEECK